MGHVSFIPEEGERALIVGQTGSGKTAFAVWLMERIPRSPGVIYDTKEEPKFARLANSIIVHSQAECDAAVDDPRFDYIVFRPPVELQGDPEKLDNFLWHHYQRYHKVWAYIDEAGTFHRGGHPFKGLLALMARGRSRGITTLCSTQRPVSISRSLITEATKAYVFRLVDLQDRKRLGDVIPEFAKYPLPPKHAFYFFESGQDEPQLFEPVNLAKRYDTGYVDRSDVPGGQSHTVEPNAPKHLWI